MPESGPPGTDIGGRVAPSARIRPAGEADWARIWPLWHAVVAAGDTYAYPPDAGSEEARGLWLPGPPAETWLCLVGEQVAGTYLLSPNKPGPASHLANAGFMVDPAVRGRGIGRQLAAHCFDRARELGYRGMVFNAVVSTNPAVRLWQSLGFAEVGRVPGAFRLPDASFADLLIMYRDL